MYTEGFPFPVGYAISNWFYRHSAGGDGGVFFLPLISILQVIDSDKGVTLFCATMSDGEEFTLSFTHSVNKRPVYDTLRARGDHIEIVKSRYDAFGAGMPETSNEEGVLSVLADGWLEWRVNRPVPEIIVRVGRVAGHTLWVGDRQIRLADLAVPGSALVFRVQRSSILKVLIGGCL